MPKPYAATAGAIVGSVLVLVAFMCLFRSWRKKHSRKTSEAGSSDPSVLAEWNTRRGASSSAPGQTSFGSQGARQFTLEELELATKQFSDINLIGYGSFGPVYKGLLRDSVIAIKRHFGPPRQDFIAEVIRLSEIQHRNLVSLLGYCQERDNQMLVFEYVTNGSMCNHLYDTEMETSTKLEFKQRLSIALGAAKGLLHLHSLNPPLIHKNFKMANVLVDENFIVKVADVGITQLLEKIEEAGPSQSSTVNAFLDPEVRLSGTFTELSDVYSFGVFLLELITGLEASMIKSLGSQESLIQWVSYSLRADSFVDNRLTGTFTTEGIRDMIRLSLQCLSFPAKRRPKTEMVVNELERILEKEMALTTVMGDGTPIFTKGSELFS